MGMLIVDVCAVYARLSPHDPDLFLQIRQQAVEAVRIGRWHDA